MEGLFEEMERVRDIIKEYDALPPNAGAFGSLVMRQSIQKAEIAIKENDVVKMLQAYEGLKEHDL